ncbi:MAG: oligosaccharide flippase family protein [bacterium]|jgi:O-antigen/teichoic acid export membrane protein|nr:oligosaccharide flippase family protein [bacterium]
MTDQNALAPVSTISKNTILLATYQLINGLVQFVLFLLLLRWIPQEHMDVYELGRSCLEIGVGVIGSSVAAVIVRENARDEAWWGRHAVLVRKLLRVSALILALLLYLLVVASSHSAIYLIVIGLFCLTIYFQSRTDLYEAIFRSRDHVRIPVCTGILVNVSVTGLTLFCVLVFPFPVGWAAGGVLLRWLIQGMLLAWFSRQQVAQASVSSPRLPLRIQDLILEIAPISVGAIAFIIYARIDVLMLQWLGYEETIAIYGCAFRPIGFLTLFTAAFYHAFAPSISRLIHHDPRSALCLALKVGGGLAFLGLGLAFGIVLYREEITRLLYPPAFAAAADGMWVLAWSLPIIFGGNAVGFYLVNYGKQGAMYYMKINIFGVLINVIGNGFAIYTYGFIGAAVVTVVTDAITTLLMLIVSLSLSRRDKPARTG